MNNSYKPGIVASNRGSSTKRMLLEFLTEIGVIDGFEMELKKVDLDEFLGSKEGDENG